MTRHNDCLIVIPSYQPEETLFYLTKGLATYGYQILIVNDGSEETFNDVFSRCEQYGQVLSYSKNKGKGFALKYAFEYAQKNYKDINYVLTVDGDGQHHIKDINELTNTIKERKEIIICERRFDVKVPFKSKIGNSLSKFSQSLSTFRYMNDNQCGLRAFPFSFLDDLIKIKGNRYEYEMEVLNYLLIKEIPFSTLSVDTVYENGVNATTHFRPILDTFLIQKSILKCGLVNIICFLLGLALTCVFYYCFFSSSGLCPLDLSYEVSIFIAIPLEMMIHIIINIIIFKPKSIGRMILRLVLFNIIYLLSIIITVSFFSRVCSFNIICSYLLTYPLIVFPLYYLIKGVTLVYNSRR